MADNCNGPTTEQIAVLMERMNGLLQGSLDAVNADDFDLADDLLGRYEFALRLLNEWIDAGHVKAKMPVVEFHPGHRTVH